MIKALLLIFSSAATWQRIAETPRKWVVVLVGYLTPMLVLACAAEGYGLVHWGKPRGEFTALTRFSVSQAVVYEVGQFILSLAIVFIAAALIKSLGETFHGRHNFSQTFTLAAYGLSPIFLLRLLDAFPSVSPWVTWLIGIVLTISILYSGIPLVMRPDPPHALGLYLMSSMFLLMITGLTRFVTIWYLQGKFTKLDSVISHITN
jgi:hypothetical protein